MKKLFTILLVFGCIMTYGQTDDPAEMEETITKVTAIHSQRDTVRLNEIVQIQLNVSAPVESFTKLYINGLEVGNDWVWKVSEVDQSIFVKFDDDVYDIVESLVKNESATSIYVPVKISVANDEGIVARAADPLYMVVKYKIDKAWLWVGLMGLPFLLLTIYCIWKGVLLDERNECYSLSRTQLFVWTVIFGSCYFYIWIVTGSLPDITSSALVILGISAGTTAVAKVIENEHERNGNHAAAVVAPVVPVVPAAPAAPVAAAAPVPAAPVPVAPVAAQPNVSRGWLLDILSDRNGTNLSVHRFQNVIFTVVFGLIFIQKVIASTVLPDFDDNALLLMGISSTTYAGLKITERP